MPGILNFEPNTKPKALFLVGQDVLKDGDDYRNWITPMIQALKEKYNVKFKVIESLDGLKDQIITTEKVQLVWFIAHGSAEFILKR